MRESTKRPQFSILTIISFNIVINNPVRAVINTLSMGWYGMDATTDKQTISILAPEDNPLTFRREH
jgi:hypothetical protein